jgi:uncharacterized protein (DUF2336 family)
MPLTPQALLAELDTALPQAEESWRSMVLRQITDLFLSGAELYNDQHVALFDAVMSRLLPGLDRADLAELGNRLAGIANAPLNVLASLARHLDVSICGPVLERAQVLPDRILAEAADRDRVDPNILAKIAARPQLNEAVTDVLLKRGGPQLQRRLINNPNARISEGGFARVIMGLDGDKDLAQAIAARDDLPAELRPWLKDILAES